MEINFEHINLIPQILEELKSLNAKLSSTQNATNQKRWLSTEELADSYDNNYKPWSECCTYLKLCLIQSFTK